MNLPQQKRRESLFQLIYSFEMSDGPSQDSVAIAHTMEMFKVTKKLAYTLTEEAEKVWSARAMLDQKIEALATEYPLKRITKVELCVLRLLLWELSIEKSIPLEIAITEGRRLSKKFSHPEAAEFVVALLNASVERGDV